MNKHIYVFHAANRQLFAARPVAKGERYGESYEHAVREPAVIFYQPLTEEFMGEEISPGHLRGRRLSEPLPLGEFMEQESSLSLERMAMVSELDGASVASVQNYFTRVGVSP